MPKSKRKTEGRAPDQGRMELHQLISVSRRFRRNVGFAGPFIADHHACRRLAHRIGLAARARGQAEPPPRPSHLYALFLIEEILRYVVHLFLDQMNPELFADLDKWVEKEQGPAEPLAKEFRLAFFLPGRPAPAADLKTFMSGRTLGMPNRHLLLRELLLLRTGTLNPAYRPFQDIFDDSRLEEAFSYRLRVSGWQPFFEEQPRFGPDQQSLPEMLHSPAAASPHSLFGQLEFMLRHWGSLLGRYRDRLLQALDFLREEDRMRGGGPGPARVLDFEGLEGEFYSPDREWMPRVVLIAKSALVWLQQLSVRYSRAVDRLDQIPDEELDLLAGRGFNALWLIGIWERSPASQRIKRRCGNPEAEASAYSLKTYGVADFLGGEAALENLKSRCSARGIRLACDMVPNHTGLDAPWVYDHPDWFVQVQHPPFPAYSFNGENLADRPGFGLYLEDHYYDRSDAAVVFKWVRFDGGETRYLYHGNDGTHLPWNDTAQLNYLLPEVREAVMSSILDTARRFSIIRFDAAMTLTRKHFQRLWFPEPGGGGDIPSRSEHGLGRRDFMQRMPAEFWRQVVDRVAQEAPDTLLLAEAFWLMEGYFVRTLGMHRVYNSAFMNMLKMEENWKYRTLIKNTLEFDPQILKRYVNFMNNPDEETAVAQFGKGDKYFGVCLMMATLPGLPLFGHGQVEGFREKYGMEYRRAYWNEEPDPELIRRHEQLIFPLLRRRALFAGVEHFALYDLFTEEGKVNENVFAYSNGEGGERSLVVYNNRFEQARGWIRVSCAFTEKDPGSGERRMRQKKLAEALGLSRKPRAYVRFREHASRLHYLRSCRRLWDEGFFLELGAYHFQVFLDFQEKEDDARGLYRELERTLGGRGVADLEACLKEVELRPLFEGFRALCSADLIRQAREGEAGPAPGGPKVRPLAGPKVRPKDGAKVRPKDGAAIEGLGSNASALFEAAAPFLPEGVDKDKAAARAAAEVPKRFNRLWPRISRAASLWGEARLKWPVLIAWAVVSGLENGLSGAGAARDNGWLLEAWRLKRPLQEAWSGAGLAGEEAEDSLRLLGTLLRRMPGGRAPASRTSVRGGRPEARDLLPALLQEAEVRGFLKVHEHQGAQWFGQERMETLAGVLVRLLPAAGISGSASPLLKGWLELSASAGYHWDRFLEAAHGL